MFLPAANRLPPLLAGLSNDERSMLVEGAAQGLWIFVPETETVEWSPATIEMLGYDRGMTSLSGVTDLVHPDDQERHADAIRRTLEGDEPYRVEVRLRRGDGEYRWYLATGIVLPARDDQSVRLVGFVADIGDKHRIESERQRWESRFRAFMDQCPGAVYLKDRDGRHLYANSATARLTGVPLAKIIQSTTEELFPRHVAEQLRAVDNRVLDQNKPSFEQMVLEARDGSKRHVMDMKFPVPGAEGDETMLGGFGFDITEKVEREREVHALDHRMQATQRLESIGILAGGIAHDFNNMLLTIRGNVELALIDDDPSEREQMMRDVLERCDDAAKLCRQLLLYGGNDKSRRERVEPAKIQAEANVLKDLTRKLGVSLELEVDSTAPPIECDPVQLGQVLLDLTANAAEAVKDIVGGEIKLHCDSCTECSDLPVYHSWIRDPAPTRFLRITVTDNGIGMSPSVVERVFEPFFSTREIGHGLGLATVLGIVKSHRGSIGVSSSQGKGTRVVICLPASGSEPESDASGSSTPHRRPHRAPAAPQRPFDGRSVLIVDDQEMVLETATRLVSHLGAGVLAADSLNSAMEIVTDDSRTIDLALVDITMPGGSGIELAVAIREHAPALPIILMSGFVEFEVEPPKDLPFLAKPFDLQELQEAMQSALDD